jgi:aminoglycoside phosphotransferase (APT) family kinase protein
MTHYPWIKPLLQYLNTQENSKITLKKPPEQLEYGVETIIFKIQLEYAPPQISQPLVLRMYKAHTQNTIAQIEGITQNYLYDNNYPAPKVHYICIDTSILGTPFIIMDFIHGDSLAIHENKVASTLAEYMIKLHQIDPEPLQKRFKTAGIPEKNISGLGTLIEFLESRNIKWLDPAIEWLMDNEPNREFSIVHDDLHAGNVKFKDGQVSGVLDWSGIIDDRLRDVGSTLVLYHELIPCVYPDRREEFRIRMKDFLRKYSDVYTVDPWKLEYYEAVRCFRVMVGFEIGFEMVLESGMHKVCYNRFAKVTGLKLDKPW